MKLGNVIGMLVLVLLAAGLFFWSQRESSKSTAGAASLLDAFDKRDVARLELNAGEETMVLRRSTGDSERWEMTLGEDVVRADAYIIDEILNALSRAEVRVEMDIAQVSDVNLTSYGLDAPAISCTLTLPGEKRSARFGKLAQDTENVYADRGAGTNAFVVPRTALDEIQKAFNQGVRDKRLTDFRTFDVKRIEIMQNGVATLEAEKDISQIWRIRQPYAGYADPTLFETVVSHIVNEQHLAVAEDGTQDFARYGLARPAAEVTLESKRGTKRVFLVGKLSTDVPGARFAMEQGTRTVYVVGPRFVGAVFVDAQEFRDHAFTRLGHEVTALTVKLGDAAPYKLLRAHTDWEIEQPAPRHPADGDLIKDDTLRLLREWHTVAFHDGMEPAEAEISEDGDRIDVETQGGGTVTLLIGQRLENGNYFAQRLGDGRVEEVQGAPVEMLKKGYVQFRRKTVREYPVDDIERFSVDKGFAESGMDVQTNAFRRDVQADDSPWRDDGPGTTGVLDAEAVNDFIAALKTIMCEEWLFWDARRNEEMGFGMDGGSAATARITIDFAEHLSPPPHGHAQILLIGNRLESGDYYARLKGNQPSHWAFVLARETVERLIRRLKRQD